MRNVYLDCGTQLCQGLRQISKNHNINSDWTVYSFEANPVTYSIIDKQKYPHVNFVNKGVWIEDCFRDLNTAIWPGEIRKSDEYNLIDEKVVDAQVGGGSNIMGDNFNFIHDDPKYVFKKSHNIECFDLSSFILKNFSKEDFIVVKLDIEGAEYPVLEKMIKDGSISYVNVMYVEFHNHHLTDRYDEDAIRVALQNNNVKLEFWS